MMDKNQQKNVEHICSLIKKGELFPINLYSYRITCNCEDTELRVSGVREELEVEFQKCPNCKSPYNISGGLVPIETAMLLFLNKPDGDRMPAMGLGSCTPEIIEKLDLAGKWVLKRKSYLLPKIQRKINLFTRKR